jgi:hypothetical protein
MTYMRVFEQKCELQVNDKWTQVRLTSGLLLETDAKMTQIKEMIQFAPAYFSINKPPL